MINIVFHSRVFHTRLPCENNILYLVSANFCGKCTLSPVLYCTTNCVHTVLPNRFYIVFHCFHFFHCFCVDRFALFALCCFLLSGIADSLPCTQEAAAIMAITIPVEIRYGQLRIDFGDIGFGKSPSEISASEISASEISASEISASEKSASEKSMRKSHGS